LIETSQPVLTTHALPARKTVVSAGHEWQLMRRDLADTLGNAERMRRSWRL
jgi:hypothetical protein